MDIATLHEHFLKSAGVATDTRGIQTNQLFFALKGDNFNGNTFADKALLKGAKYVVIDEEHFEKNERFILVQDVLETLQKLSTYHRDYLNIPILAITGSNGKTTSKELIHAVLRKKYNAVATTGNLNNHIGVPLTLLSMKSKTEFGIVEMGANHHHEIANLCKIAKPNYGYITNFGKAHLEGFGSVEGVITAKSELYDHLKASNGLLFLNLDDPIQQKQITYSNNFTFGNSSKADISIDYLNSSEKAEVTFDDKHIKSQLTGKYNAINMAAAICIGKYFKVSIEGIQKAIQEYIPTNNRSQIIKLGSNSILMDAYNANPTSMMAALESFKNNLHPNKLVILGDMFELGKSALEEHEHIAEYLKRTSISNAWLVGSNFYKTTTRGNSIKKFETFEELKEHLEETSIKDAYILIKGSRGMALERVLDQLKLQESNR